MVTRNWLYVGFLPCGFPADFLLNQLWECLSMIFWAWERERDANWNTNWYLLGNLSVRMFWDYIVFQDWKRLAKYIGIREIYDIWNWNMRTEYIGTAIVYSFKSEDYGNTSKLDGWERSCSPLKTGSCLVPVWLWVKSSGCTGCVWPMTPSTGYGSKLAPAKLGDHPVEVCCGMFSWDSS